MEMPKVGPEHAQLLAFVGEWEGDEELAPSAWGPGGAAFGRMSFRADLDGFHKLSSKVRYRILVLFVSALKSHFLHGVL